MSGGSQTAGIFQRFDHLVIRTHVTDHNKTPSHTTEVSNYCNKSFFSGTAAARSFNVDL